MRKTGKYLYMISVATALFLSSPINCTASDYSQVASAEEQTEAVSVGKYGMLPIYPRDIKNGTYSIEVESSSSMFRITKAELTVKDEEMEAVLTLSGKGYLKLFMGTGEDAASGSESAYIDHQEDAEGMYTYTVPVEALDKALNCAAFSERKQKWYDRVILFDASTLPEEAVLLDLPDYDAIEAAMKGQTISNAASSNVTEAAEEEELPAQEPVEPMEIDMEDGEYSIETEIFGGSGKAGVSSPTILKVENGKAYAQLVWSSSNYDYMIVGTEKYLNLNTDGGNSTFEIPVAAMDTELPVIADTTAMGTPHEVAYILTFYADTIGSKSQMPQEAAKRVVAIAMVIIVGGGILNRILNKRRRA